MLNLSRPVCPPQSRTCHSGFAKASNIHRVDKSDTLARRGDF